MDATGGLWAEPAVGFVGRKSGAPKRRIASLFLGAGATERRTPTGKHPTLTFPGCWGNRKNSDRETPHIGLARVLGKDPLVSALKLQWLMSLEKGPPLGLQRINRLVFERVFSRAPPYQSTSSWDLFIWAFIKGLHGWEPRIKALVDPWSTNAPIWRGSPPRPPQAPPSPPKAPSPKPTPIHRSLNQPLVTHLPWGWLPFFSELVPFAGARRETRVKLLLKEDKLHPDVLFSPGARKSNTTNCFCFHRLPCGLPLFVGVARLGESLFCRGIGSLVPTST